MGFPDPLKTRPSKKNEHIRKHKYKKSSKTIKYLPNISSDTGVLKMSPVNSHNVFLASIPEVPSNTCTTALEPLTSKTYIIENHKEKPIKNDSNKREKLDYCFIPVLI